MKQQKENQRRFPVNMHLITSFSFTKLVLLKSEGKEYLRLAGSMVLSYYYVTKLLLQMVRHNL